MINIALQIRPLLGGADCAGMVALNHRNNQAIIPISLLHRSAGLNLLGRQYLVDRL
jgi:hypothetical protein